MVPGLSIGKQDAFTLVTPFLESLLHTPVVEHKLFLLSEHFAEYMPNEALFVLVTLSTNMAFPAFYCMLNLYRSLPLVLIEVGNTLLSSSY